MKSDWKHYWFDPELDARQRSQNVSDMDKYWHGSRSMLEPGAGLIRRGAGLALEGRHEEALSWFEKAIRASPDETFAYLHKSLSLAQIGRTGEAEQCFKRGMDLDFADLMSWRKFKMAFMPRMPREIISWMDGPQGRVQGGRGASNHQEHSGERPGDPVLEPKTAELENRGALEMRYFMRGDQHFDLMLALERCSPVSQANAFEKEISDYKKSIQKKMAKIRERLPQMDDFVSPRYVPWARMKLAVLYDSFEIWDKSVALLDKVIRDTECPDAMCLKGMVMQDNGKSAEELDTTLECYGTEISKPERSMSGGEYLYDAIQCYDNAIICAPNLCAAHYNKARAYHELGEIPHAMACLGTAVRLLLNPDYDAAAILREYRIEKRTIDTGSAPSIENGESLSPMRREAQTLLPADHAPGGENAEKSPPYEPPEDDALEQKRAMPAFPGGWPGSRDVELDLDDMVYESLEIFDLSIAMRPKKDHASHLFKAHALYNMGRYAEAIPHYDAYIDAEHADVHHELIDKADALRKMKLYEQAMSCYNDALQSKPRSVRARIKKSEMYRKRKEFEKALSCLDIKFDMTRENTIKVLSEKTILYFMTGRPEKSMVCISEALKLDPKNSYMLFNKAAILHNYYDVSKDRSKLKESIACYDAVMNSDDASADAAYNRGLALTDFGMPEEAALSFRNATILNPKMSEAFDSWGNALNDIGRYEQALECYDRAISLKPDYAEAFYNKAKSLYQLDRIKESADCLDEAMAMGADLRDANEIREMLQRRLDFNDRIHKE